MHLLIRKYYDPAPRSFRYEYRHVTQSGAIVGIMRLAHPKNFLLMPCSKSVLRI